MARVVTRLLQCAAFTLYYVLLSLNTLVSRDLKALEKIRMPFEGFFRDHVDNSIRLSLNSFKMNVKQM